MPPLRPDDGDALTRALNDIFSDYLEKERHLRGRFDREVRDPRPILDAASALDLIPARERLLTITGSKGKGTVARSAAAALEGAPAAAFADTATGGAVPARVGLIVSPNEVEQTDRLRINGAPIDGDAFLAAYGKIRAHLHAIRQRLAPPRYLSPFGAMLLIGFQWFRDNAVDWVVLEGGRGAAFDEVGRLPAAVSVVTAVEDEHRDRLGPSLADIARDKISIADGSNACFLGPGVAATLHRLDIPLPPNTVDFDPQWIDEADLALPRWVAVDRALGRNAARRLALDSGGGEWPNRAPLPPPAGGSFGMGRLTAGDDDGQAVRIVFDATGRPQALDVDWYRRAMAGWRMPLAVVCLSDQKDVSGMARLLDDMGLSPVFLTLNDAALHTFESVASGYADRIVGAVGYDDHASLAKILRRMASAGDHDVLACFGIQPYIRLIRRIIIQEC